MRDESNTNMAGGGGPPMPGSAEQGSSQPGCIEIDALLAEYVEGALENSARQRVSQHLLGCTACAESVEAMQAALAVCRVAALAEPPLSLVRRVIEKTTGRLSWKQHLRLFVRPALEPRLAMGMAMALLSFSIVLNAAGVNLSGLTLADLKPSRMMLLLDRQVNLAGAKVVKYYRELRIVYEIQTQLQAIRDTAAPPENPRPQPQQAPQSRPPAQNKWSQRGVYVAALIL